MKYRNIIREEINKFMINEAVNIASLSNFINPLKKYSSDIMNISGIKEAEVNNFLNGLNRYILQIIFGIERCVKANSLNEAFRASDYGIEIPRELGGQFLDNFENEFYKGSNWVGNKMGYNAKGAARYNGGVGGSNNVNPNSVPTVKLADSLRELQKYAFEYQRLDARFNIQSVSQAPADALMEIGNLQREYQKMINAQGTNP